MKQTYKREEVAACVTMLRNRLKGRRDMNRRTVDSAEAEARDPLAWLRAKARVDAYQVALDDVFAVFLVGGLLEPTGPTVAKARRKPQRRKLWRSKD